jgi:hypothetical protein
LRPWIWRSQAFCEPQEWYIAIGRWVIACSGKPLVVRLALERRIPERQRVEVGAMRSRCARAAGTGAVALGGERNFCSGSL